MCKNRRPVLHAYICSTIGQIDPNTLTVLNFVAIFWTIFSLSQNDFLIGGLTHPAAAAAVRQCCVMPINACARADELLAAENPS